MAKKSGDRQLHEAEFRCNARKRMPENMGRDILELGLVADTIKNAYDADEVPATPIHRNSYSNSFHLYELGATSRMVL